ncbi:hypothetical protein K470DRAFT_262701 [Piedraia hortae CBS 480.64]|uniref:Uncharacterized protein n=1 Tax=Piedraia hortae CBS 480.64 TaxID=1314780 RepID=A0A6A7C6G4_9PEZI|nr:hypothetical protein K470DRAFT_262701 [Piedraia hortae CBS 480.64]
MHWRQYIPRLASAVRHVLFEPTLMVTRSFRQAAAPRQVTRAIPTGRLVQSIISRAVPATVPLARQATARQRPLVSTLRPNLTGGVLGRTTVGGVRDFSTTPLRPAQIVQNVHQAVRLFALAGRRAEYAGLTATGDKQYRIDTLRDAPPATTAGCFIQFQLAPMLTAVDSVPSDLNSSLLNDLAADFGRTMKELSHVHEELRRLARLGNLPISSYSSGVRVHLPGVDEAQAERICDDLGITRGAVVPDMELLYPCCPDTAESLGISQYSIDLDGTRTSPSRQTMSESSQGIYRYIAELDALK